MMRHATTIAFCSLAVAAVLLAGVPAIAQSPPRVRVAGPPDFAMSVDQEPFRHFAEEFITAAAAGD